MESQCKVSIIMPTYNRGYVIQNAIRSVIDQTFTQWELIIVDDGSEDGTKRIVDQFADSRIRYEKIDHCGFVSKVRNKGNSLATSDIIIVHDSDDVAFPDRVQEIMDAFDDETDVVYHGFYMRFFDPYTNATSRQVRPAARFSKERLLHEQYIPGQIAYKKKCILETPYDERIKCCDDYQILLEFALKDYKFKPIYKNLYEYVETPDSINVSGEMDGSRKKDTEIILSILKEKYNVEATAQMVKNIINTGDIVDRQFVKI